MIFVPLQSHSREADARSVRDQAVPGPGRRRVRVHRSSLSREGSGLQGSPSLRPRTRQRVFCFWVNLEQHQVGTSSDLKHRSTNPWFAILKSKKSWTSSLFGCGQIIAKIPVIATHSLPRGQASRDLLPALDWRNCKMIDPGKGWNSGITSLELKCSLCRIQLCPPGFR